MPRVDYDLLREYLQIRPEQNLYFFPDGKPPFAVPQEILKPLSRAIVAPERARASIVELKGKSIAESLEAPTITHRRQGMFSLWRGTATEERKASELAAPASEKKPLMLAGRPDTAPPPLPRPRPKDDDTGQRSPEGSAKPERGETP